MARAGKLAKDQGNSLCHHQLGVEHKHWDLTASKLHYPPSRRFPNLGRQWRVEAK